MNVPAIAAKSLKVLGYTALGACIAILAAGIWLLESRPDLDVWHTARLDEEFTADSDVKSFAEYLALEDRLFAQLDELVYDRVPTEARRLAMRYRRGSPADPVEWPRNWNRSYELQQPAARAGVLLLHGMSDSPYSLRSIGGALHERGATVVSLRLPGHGTAPSGLVRIAPEDLIAAVRIGVEHTRQLAGNAPVYIVGYSAGGALAVDYALSAIENDELLQVDGIVLVSPAIGVTSAAMLARWQRRAGWILGLQKLAWNSLELEYDPFKYGSFAVNAADVVYQLTFRIRGALDRHARDGELERLPPILAFLSIVDATVSTPALIDRLMARLPARRDELVVFDIDRSENIERLLVGDPTADIKTAMGVGNLPFSISVITNRHASTDEVIVRHQPANSVARTDTPLNVAWPPDIVSLSHNALPFPPSDEIYGALPPADPDRLYLGNLSFRGERNLLAIPASAQLRLRWNPFYDYLERRTIEFMRLE
ncbi:MAG: alpha/beta hydrolase [Gammaproteobacteria bacterium]